MVAIAHVSPYCLHFPGESSGKEKCEFLEDLLFSMKSIYMYI